MTAATMNPAALAPLAQADLLFLVARLFALPEAACETPWPAAEDLCDAVAVAGWGDSPEMAELLARAGDEIAATDLDAWVAEFSRLFEGAMACPANETAYIRRDKGAILADIAGFHRAFRLTLNPSSAEKADHLAAELELLALLLVMTGQAEGDGHAGNAEVARAAAVAFGQDHLGEWVDAFCERLRITTGITLFQVAADVLQLLWLKLAGDYGMAPAPDAATRAPEESPGSPYECDMAAHEMP